MGENLRDKVLNKNPWAVVLLAFVLLVLGQFFLVQQYRVLENERIADLEAKVERHAKELDKAAAIETVQEFFEARVIGDQERAFRFITERAALEISEDAVMFFGVQDFEIQEQEKTSEDLWRFQVEVTRSRLKTLELVQARKIEDMYYVDSIQIAG